MKKNLNSRFTFFAISEIAFAVFSAAAIVFSFVIFLSAAANADEVKTQENRLEQDVIFCIGTPDAFCSEFALVKEGYANFPNKFADEVVYEVGKSKPNVDWAFLHPSKQDQYWAKGGETHPFTIKFNSDKNIDEPTTFIIGYVGTQGDLSKIIVTINQKELPAQLPKSVGFANLVFKPKQKGAFESNLFTVPAGTIKQGENVIKIVLEGKSWILYDYVALRKESKPLAIIERPVIDLLAQFRRNENAPMHNVKKIIFAARGGGLDGHWYANFGYYADDENKFTFPNYGGKLCAYDLDTKKTEVLFEDAKGSIRDPQVHYTENKIIFSYRPTDKKFFHIYEINTDGSNLKQITDGEFDDIEPTYTAEGKIIFASSRAKRWVQCWLTPVAILYGCDADGKNIHALSGNVEHDNTPWPLPNGQILYTRWEYVDRSQVDYHHLWTMNPDGTRQMVFYGNMHPSIVFIDAKPIPNSDKIVASFSWGHGNAEHAGSIGVIDPRNGPDDRGSARAISSAGNYRDPWAFSESAFLAARGTQMILMDEDGNEQVIFDLPQEWKNQKLTLHEPRPIIQRQPERVIGSSIKPNQTTGQLMLIDVYQGRNMVGVKRGEIKKLLILETLPKPINFTGGMEPLTYGGSFTLERIVGTVPVEADGSAHFELPALRSFFFVALDENDLSVKRMQSFHSVMPGESTACIGCHEVRTGTPVPVTKFPTAMKRPPSPITPVADYRGVDYVGNKLTSPTGIPDVLDFPRDIQPILDAHCVKCHSPEQRDGGVSLVGDRTPLYSISYYTITAKQLVADGRNLPKSNYPPRTLGSSASRLVKLCDGSHYETKLTQREKDIIRLWCDTGASYLGTYAGLGCGMVGGYAMNHLDRQDLSWTEVQKMTSTLRENCISCHTSQKNMQLPLSPSHEIGGPPWENMRPNDVRRKYSRQLLYDLSYPEKSVMLLAPLAKSAGGYESCGTAILTSKDDPKYQSILAGITRTKQHLDSIKRFDMNDFIPRKQYIRELQKYGILPKTHNPTTPVNTYDLEQKYWRSLWYSPKK
ncbi:MAG: hypothetical protein LBQ66_00630 [Planctomycetaceae bacterium]|jgi:hypothetical protein|nr:hypothetical protein [Planctomycetaceae bacterium]